MEIRISSFIVEDRSQIWTRFCDLIKRPFIPCTIIGGSLEVSETRISFCPLLSSARFRETGINVGNLYIFLPYPFFIPDFYSIYSFTEELVRSLKGDRIVYGRTRHSLDTILKLGWKSSGSLNEYWKLSGEIAKLDRNLSSGLLWKIFRCNFE